MWQVDTTPQLIGSGLARPPPCQNDFLHRPDQSPMHEPLFTDDAQRVTTNG